MIYLLGEIVVYLLAALLLGMASGWLLHGARRSDGRRAPLEESASGPAARPGPPPGPDPRIASLEEELRVRLARIQQLEAALTQRGPDASALTRRLTATEQRVAELERERELQNRALRVMHQQLELASERVSRGPARATGTRG